MSFQQHTPKEVVGFSKENSKEKIARVECEKTGTIYYECLETKKQGWTQSDVKIVPKSALKIKK